MEGAVASNVSSSSSVGVEERMEGAVSSMIQQLRRFSSVTAESGTRGMDSGDQEPDLPSAVQHLMERLEGKTEPLRWLPTLTSPDFRDIFPESASLSTNVGWRSQVGLRVLEAIGSCNTIEVLEVGDVCGGDISRLTASEWEVLLRGFRCSTVLRVIRVEGLTWTSLAEVESLCLQLGEILKTSSVIVLTISDCRLSARCFLNLASGLQGNSQSILKSLELRNAWEESSEESSVVKHLADMINSATRLETLEIGGSWDRMYDMDEKDAIILSQALIQSSSLKQLVLNEVEGEASAFLLKALDGDEGNRGIECLHLISVSGIGECLRELLRSNPYLKEVTLTAIEMRPEEWSQLGQAICENATARTIRVTHVMHHKDNLKGVENLASAASSDVKDPTVELKITFYDYEALMSALTFVGRVLRGQIRSLKALILYLVCPCPSGSNQNRMESIVPMDNIPAKFTLLKRLKLFVQSKDTLKGVWKYLLRCLRDNTSLIHLDLSDSELDDEAFRDLMDLLQVNLTLQEIDVSRTSWETDGKAAQIQEFLGQNQNRAVYMAVFRQAKLTFGDAKAGRLFLCGSPLAGKTQLRQTLMSIVQGRSWLGKKWDELMRTTGIEVEFMVNIERGQISIWDLAGQRIFRILQNVLFPRTSHFCIFLFVYSHFCEKTSSNKEESCFQIELEEWMSFISSSTRVTGHNRPQVLVLISHKDKDKSSSLNWAHLIVDKVSATFAKFVYIHPLQICFHVNAKKKSAVLPLKNQIFEMFDKWGGEKFPRVPVLCSQLLSLLVTNTRENRNCPLWRSQKFKEFCAPIFTQFFPPSPNQWLLCAVDHSKLTNSIISYLNDVGSIVYIPNLDYIIVDPNWLTHTLLGELVALGQNFQTQETGSYSYISQDGFVSEAIFARLIKEFLSKQPHGQIGVDREVIEEILINLDLCFKLEDTCQYFIPSFIREHASMEEEKHQEVAHVESMAWRTRDKNSHFVGIRIQCEDERTMSLTAAFFPCFQIFMRRKLISEKYVSKDMVTCSRHYLRLFLDGHQIYVQQGRSYKYVDVLMLCSKHKSREGAVNYLMKHVVKELISFCASSKGCPGVRLVLGLIQTLCVKMLIPSHLRGTILIEDLKSNFIRNIKDKLEDIPLDKSHLESEDELFNYEHSWPLIKGHTTEVTSEKARDLLWKRDVEAVVNEIRQERMQQLQLLESLHQGLVKQRDSLQQGLIELKDDLTHSHPENEKMITSSNYPDMKDFNRPSSRCLIRASTSVGNRDIRLVLYSIHQVGKDLGQKVEVVGQKVDGVDDRLTSVQSILQRLGMKMEHILSLQQELQSTRSDFMSKLDMIIEYSEEFQHTKTPKRPYVTDDVGILYKMRALVHAGTTVTLHLMCESATGFHKVKDQEGLKIHLDRESCGWIRKTIEISSKLMYYAAKAGLDVTLGVGQAIPEWGDLKSDIVKLDGISDRDRRAVLKGGESKELTEAWLRIQQTLAPVNYSAIFKLYQVKYVRLELGGHAWVCEECMNKGHDSGNFDTLGI